MPTTVFLPSLLKAARERAGLTVAQSAVAARRTGSVIHSYERGTFTPPARMLAVLATIYNCPVADFYSEIPGATDTVAAYDEQVRAIVAGMPPLSDGQRQQLVVLLGGAA